MTVLRILHRPGPSLSRLEEPTDEYSVRPLTRLVWVAARSLPLCLVALGNDAAPYVVVFPDVFVHVPGAVATCELPLICPRGG